MSTTIVASGTDPTVTIKELPAWKMVLVRTARSFLQSLLGLLTASAMGIISYGELKRMVLIAACPALISFIQNSIEILTRLDSNDSYAKYRA